MERKSNFDSALNNIHSIANTTTIKTQGDLETGRNGETAVDYACHPQVKCFPWKINLSPSFVHRSRRLSGAADGGLLACRSSRTTMRRLRAVALVDRSLPAFLPSASYNLRGDWHTDDAIQTQFRGPVYGRRAQNDKQNDVSARKQHRVQNASNSTISITGIFLLILLPSDAFNESVLLFKI